MGNPGGARGRPGTPRTSREPKEPSNILEFARFVQKGTELSVEIGEGYENKGPRVDKQGPPNWDEAKNRSKGRARRADGTLFRPEGR